MENPLYKLPSLANLLSTSFQFYKKNFSLIAGISIIPVIVSLLTFFVEKEPRQLSHLITAAVISIVVSLSSYFSYLALMKVITSNGLEQGGVVGAYSSGLKYFFPLLWVSILVSIAVSAGLLLLVIPGIYLALTLSVATYVLFAENKRGFSALVQSQYYTRYHWLSLLGKVALLILMMLVIMGLLFLVGVLVFKVSNFSYLQFEYISSFVSNLIGSVFISPIFMILFWNIYNLLKSNTAPMSAEVEIKIRKNFRTFFYVALGVLVLGVVAIVLLVK